MLICFRCVRELETSMTPPQTLRGSRAFLKAVSAPPPPIAPIAPIAPVAPAPVANRVVPSFV